MRFDPAFHFFIIPCLLVLFIASIVNLARHLNLANGEFTLLVLAVIVLALRSRMYSLKVQDRVIRLEERLRLAALADTGASEWLQHLTESQLIALRFASDAEVAALARRAWQEKLKAKQIKESIQTWRPDYWRV